MGSGVGSGVSPGVGSGNGVPGGGEGGGVSSARSVIANVLVRRNVSCSGSPSWMLKNWMLNGENSLKSYSSVTVTQHGLTFWGSVQSVLPPAWGTGSGMMTSGFVHVAAASSLVPT